MLQQVVLILPSHILPFQTVRLHDFGKILTICSQFCLPSKIIRSPQCHEHVDHFQWHWAGLDHQMLHPTFVFWQEFRKKFDS